MTTSQILQHKLVLAVNEEKDILDIIEEKFFCEAPNVTFHAATTFENARQYLLSYTYDLVVLDILGVRGLELLQIAHNAGVPVVILTAHAVSREALRKSIELGARAYLPLEKLGSLIPFLEEVLTLEYQSAWKKALHQVGTLLAKRFGSDRRKAQVEFWTGLKKTTVGQAGTIK